MTDERWGTAAEETVSALLGNQGIVGERCRPRGDDGDEK